MTTISSNLQAIQAQIFSVAEDTGRKPSEIVLLAVSKTFSAVQVAEAFSAGQHCFGENYLQEALDKQQQLVHLPIVWHFIGPIQSNKTRAIAESFAWVHSVDRLKVAQRLSEQRPLHLPPLQICVQVNISGEQSKSGVSPEDVLDLVKALVELPNLKLRGLMALPAPSESEAEQLAAFKQVADLQFKLKQQGFDLDTLSMGMSHDFPRAIAAGATIVRVGSAIFGARH